MQHIQQLTISWGSPHPTCSNKLQDGRQAPLWLPAPLQAVHGVFLQREDEPSSKLLPGFPSYCSGDSRDAWISKDFALSSGDFGAALVRSVKLGDAAVYHVMHAIASFVGTPSRLKELPRQSKRAAPPVILHTTDGELRRAALTPESVKPGASIPAL